MICRWCDNDNVLGRRICPHCGENTRRPEDDIPYPRPDDDAEETFQRSRVTAADVVRSLAVSVVAFAILVGGAKAAQATWPTTVWPRSSPTFETPPPEAEGPPDSGPPSVCEAGDGSVTDVTGKSYGYWNCPVERGGSLYRTPAVSAEVTGTLRLSPSWFVCQIQGDTDPQTGGSTWLYTQGDDRFLDEGWGYIPAGLVSSSWITGAVPDLPEC
jgi:hypothetical protein